MEKKSRIDLVGAIFLIGISLLFGVNQVLVKMVNSGMNPVFQAGLRSACALLPVIFYALWRGKKLSISDGSFWPGILCGLFFAFEFYLLFVAIEYTGVGRASIFFYTVPVWVAGAAHFLIPGERMTSFRAIGLFLAVCGVAFAFLKNVEPASERAVTGDLFALAAATGWAGIALTCRITKLSRSTPEMQLIYQLAVSALILLLPALFGAETFREMTPALWSIFTFQVLVVASAGILVWFWVLSIYPTSDMTSFAFLTPVFGVLLGWLVFDEPVTWNIIIALIMVGAGIYLVNKKPKPD